MDDVFSCNQVMQHNKYYYYDQKIIMSPLYRGEIYCFTSHRSFVRHISFVSVRSLCLSCNRLNTRRWPDVGLLLAHRLQRWANISPVLGYRVLFDCTLNVGQRHSRRANINQLT